MNDMDDEFDRCILCGAGDRFGSSLSAVKLWVNKTCGHKFCDECRERQFRRKSQFECPKPCGKIVSRVMLSDKSLDELEANRYTDKRKEVKSVRNKRESDFASLRAFADYDMETEDLIYALTYGNKKEIEEAEHFLASYREQHLQEIMRNKALIEAEREREKELISQSSVNHQVRFQLWVISFRHVGFLMKQHSCL